MKNICRLIVLVVSFVFFGCNDKSSSVTTPCFTSEEFTVYLVGNYWVNSEAYNCRKENGATMRLSENLWLEMGGGGPSFFLFSPDALTEYFDLVDPVLRQQYGDGYFYVSYRLAFDEDSQTITTDYDGIPKSPMNWSRWSGIISWSSAVPFIPIRTERNLRRWFSASRKRRHAKRVSETLSPMRR